MNDETRFKIKSPILRQFLKENSYYYQYLYRDRQFVYKLEKMAKEYYHVRVVDKIEQLGNKIQMIQTFLDVMK